MNKLLISRKMAGRKSFYIKCIRNILNQSLWNCQKLTNASVSVKSPSFSSVFSFLQLFIFNFVHFSQIFEVRFHSLFSWRSFGALICGNISSIHFYLGFLFLIWRLFSNFFRTTSSSMPAQAVKYTCQSNSLENFGEMLVMSLLFICDEFFRQKTWICPIFSIFSATKGSRMPAQAVKYTCLKICK